MLAPFCFLFDFERREGLDAGDGDGVQVGRRNRVRRTRDSTLEGMDRVRFGRALGYGARHAAKTLMQAADAATTPSPKRPGTPREPAAPVDRVAEKVVQTQRTVEATKKHAGKLGRSVWTPLARFSSVVWLQVTGLFFALIAMFLAQGAWKERAAVHLPLGSHTAVKFYVLGAAFAAFAYFSVSNFVRAWLRERK
jgi:hypothetical protein